MEQVKFKAVLGILRISMGLIFLWACFDKLFGLGFATKAEQAWNLGVSPTAGFLQFGVHGPFAELFKSMAGSPLVDWLFMLGLLGIGVSLTLGIFMRLGTYAGALMLLLMYLAVGIQPEHHPFIDDHFIYFFVMLLLNWGHAGKYLGLGNQWYNSALVQKYKILA
jgi:thiosulfate dehydrogenase [quinone] large subunit